MSVFPFFFQMGNASETYLFVSRISKENDFLMGTLYTIFGKAFVLFPFFFDTVKEC